MWGIPLTIVKNCELTGQCRRRAEWSRRFVIYIAVKSTVSREFHTISWATVALDSDNFITTNPV